MTWRIQAKGKYADRDFVALAKTQPVTNIGQIPPHQVKELNRLVRKGVLRKGVDAVFPVKKTYYVSVDYAGPLPEDDPPAASVPIDCTCGRCRGPAVILPGTPTYPNGWCFCPKCSTGATAEVSLGKKKTKRKRRAK